MALLTWTLVSTVSRQVSTTIRNYYPLVLGDQLLVVFGNAATTDLELWVSEDKGATWVQYAATPSSATEEGYGPVLFDDKIWFHAPTDGLRMFYTPATNPGAGGFTAEDISTFVPLGAFAPDRDHLYIAAGANLRRRISAASYPSVLPNNLNAFFMEKVPGKNDEILVGDFPGNPDNGFKRIRTGATWTELAEYDGLAMATVSGYKGFAMLGPLEAFISNNQSIAEVHRTLDGGDTASISTPQLSFFGGGVSDPRDAYGTAFQALGESRYGVFVYATAADAGHYRRHARVAKLNADATSWIAHSEQFTTDNATSLIQKTAAGVNQDGDLEFYLFVFDSAANTVKVYRATEPVTTLEAPVSDRINYAAAGASFVRYYDNLKAAAVGFPTGQSVRNNQTLWYFVGLGWVEDSRAWRDVTPLGVTDAVTKAYGWDYDNGILREIDVDRVYDDDGREVVGRIDTGFLPVASGPQGQTSDLIARWMWLRFVTREDAEVRVFADGHDDEGVTVDIEGRTTEDLRLGLVAERVRIVAYFTLRKFFRLSEIIMRVVRNHGFRPR